jgi:hypothetical protein
MTDDFKEGLIAGFDAVLSMISVQSTDPKGTPESRQALDTLAATIRIDLEEAERG